MPAPNVKSTRIGRELVANLVSHVYQLANVANDVERLAGTKHTDLRRDFIASNLPLPLVVIGADNVIMFTNEALLKYINRDSSDVIGKDVYSVLDLSFSSRETLDAWLASVRKNTVTASNSWERVRLTRPNQPVLQQFDLVAYYNKDNPEAIETMLVLFDHSKQYAQDDQAMSFVAVAVHELRTPTALLRGYTETLDEKLEGKVSGNTEQLLHQLTAAGQQLTGFVNNILNVARIESDQLELKLQKENELKLCVSAWTNYGCAPKCMASHLTAG